MGAAVKRDRFSPSSEPQTLAFLLTLLLASKVFCWLSAAPGSAQDVPEVRFEALAVVVDSRETPLAAYQFEILERTRSVKIVGIEGGAHPAFEEPPYYDPKAMLQNRVIVAAFTTEEDLPRGKTRVARLHVQVTGDGEPEYDARLVVAASSEGEEIPGATISVFQGDRK